jgi:hypothetical protein
MKWIVRLLIFPFFAACLCGCSTNPPAQTPRIVTEQDARLISLARSAAIAAGYSLKDAIYGVRRDGDGWIVQIDYAPGYTGVGEPQITLDAGFWVKFGADEKVEEILSYGGRIKPATQPHDGV